MTEQEFYQKLLAELEKAADADKQLSALLEKIQSGEASFADSAAYWQKFSALIGSVLSQNAAAPGSGLNEEVSYLMLKNGHMRAFEIMSMVQKALDEKQNLHIEPQKPKFPDERARHAAHSLEDATVSEEVIRRRAENAIANIANTFHDDYVQENAKFRNNAGLKTYITRTTTGKCCAWCTQIAGRYEYGRHPADVFRRHDHCDCIVTYENGRQRTNVWTKKSWNAPVISPDALNFKPTRFTPEQARETERKNLQYKGLTIPGKTGTIESNTFTPLSSSNSVPILRRESDSWIASLTDEERRAIQKYTKNDGDTRNDKFYARLNAMLRGERPEDEKLRYYAEQISNAIEKNSLEHDVLCYRTTKVNYFAGTNAGDIIAPGYFISTSVTNSGALNGNFKIVIRAPKGTNGAYIEKLSGYPKQREFLFDKDCKYKVISVSDDSMELEAIVWKK